MRAAQDRVARIFTDGQTPEQVAQARAELMAMDAPRQPQLTLRLR